MTNDTNKKDGFPLFKTVFNSFGLTFNNLRLYAAIGSIFSLIFMFMNFIGGQSMMCYNSDFKDSIFCSSNLFLFIISNLVLWYVVCVYIRNWYQVAILKTHKFSIKDLLPKILDFKIYAVFLAFGVSVLIVIISGFLLFIRVPNPDWKIELIYFSVVSIGFLAPVYAVSLLLNIPFIAEGMKMPKIKDLWQAVRGNVSVIFISFIGVVIINFLIVSSGFRYFVQIVVDGNIFVIVISEFLYNMFLMFAISVCANCWYIQKEFLFERS